MKKYIIPIALGMVMSCYFFPFSFTFLPQSLNTKQMLALAGMALFGYRCIKAGNISLPKNILGAFLLAILFSISCFFSITVNNTSDLTYVDYYKSFAVWMFGALGVCELYRLHYGRIDLKLMTRDLAYIGVAQCILSQMIDQIPAFQVFVDSIVEQGGAHLREINRLYGIGAALDPAGVRFSIILLLICYIIVEKGNDPDEVGGLWGYYLAILIMAVFGNMISRTTTVGLALGLGYIALHSVANLSVIVKKSQLKSLGIILLMLAVMVPVMIYLYNTNANMHSNLRFAFEGFFNWIEQGEWRTDSTDKLDAVMWVWPKDTRSWIIGNGLFGGWVYSTDIGYCRFILYCGLVGFSIFSLFFVYNAYATSRKFKGTNLMCLMLLAMTFVVWLKVSTDLFMIYALFYCADGALEHNEEETTPEITE